MAIDDNTIYGLYGSQIKDLPEKINAVKGKAKVLTSADYDWPTNNPDGVAIWKLDTGIYTHAEGVKVYYTSSINYSQSCLFAVHNNGYQTSCLRVRGAESSMQYFDVNNANGGVREQFYISQPVDNLTSSSEYVPLSAKQGKVLKDFIGDLTNLTTTDKTNLVAAINEAAASGGGGIIELTSADYNWPIANPDGVALWLLEPGMYYTEGAQVYMSGNQIGDITNRGTFIVGDDYGTGNPAKLILYYDQYTPVAYLISTIISSGNRNSKNSLLSPTVVQTTGSSTANVMSQNAVTDLIYTDDTYYKQIAIGTDAQTGDASNGNAYSVAIGTSANAGIQAGSSDNAAEATAIGSGAVARGKYGTAIGSHAKAGQDGVFRANGCVGIGSYANSFGTAIAIGGGTGKNSQSTPNIAKASYASDDGAIAIGVGAVVSSNSGKKGSIALGAGATVLNQTGVMNIGTYDTSYGYSNSGYRLLTGLYDPQTAHDAATKEYVDASLPATFTTNEWNALWA